MADETHRPIQAQALAPLGPGDLIDRAVRLYRANFLTFFWIATPPVIVGGLMTIVWRLIASGIFNVESRSNPDEADFYIFFLALGSIVIWIVELIFSLVVMGGASRNFVRHLLFGEPITFRETFRNVKARFFSLLGMSSLLVVSLGLLAVFLFITFQVLATIIILVIVAAFSSFQFIATLMSVLLVVPLAVGTGWVFFVVAGNFVYVPQAMLVEGQRALSAVGRSASLARGNATRVYALFAFTLVAIYAALALLYVPLGWYAWVEGVEILSFDPDTIPAWYEIAGQLVWQISLILLLPVLMIGLCVLYVDERVRHEGYDIELLAASTLGEIPAAPVQYSNPLHPALSKTTLTESQPAPPPKPQATVPVERPKQTGSVLGLD